MFEQVAFLSVTGSNGLQLIPGLNKPEIAIDLSALNTFVNGDLFEPVLSSGKVFRCRWNQGGIKGNLIPLEYGFHQVLLDVPKPFDEFSLEILPNRYQFEYQVKIYIKIFNPRFNVLAEKLGITLELLEAFPEQTLLFLEGLNLMSSTDTRATLAKIEAAELKAEQALTVGQGAQSTADTTANSLVEARTEMVLDRRFALTSAMFTLENGFMVADVTHDLTAGKPDMSLTDADGDDQGFAQLIAKSPTVARVELSLQQYTDNSYPLSFLLQGSKGSAIMAVFRLIAGVLSSSVDGGATLVQMATFVEYAYMLNGSIRYKRQDQSCFSYDIATGETTGDVIGNFDAGANNPLAVVIA